MTKQIGIGLGGTGGFSMEFADAAKTMRSFDGISVGAHSYPLGPRAASRPSTRGASAGLRTRKKRRP